MIKKITKYQIKLNNQAYYISYKKKSAAQQKAKNLRKSFPKVSIRVTKTKFNKWIKK